MAQQITRDIDRMIGYLKLVKKNVASGTPERIDALDLLTFVSVGLDATYNNIKEQFKLKED